MSLEKLVKRFFLLSVLLVAVLSGFNPADYDPFFDHPNSTYNLLAQEVSPYTNPNRMGRPWTQPPKGPNADACRAVWDKPQPCPVDGKFYGQWGELQPENCDNNFFMPDGKTLKPDAEKCHCNIAMTDADHCTMGEDGTMHLSIDGSTCQVYCREKAYDHNGNTISHCHCVLQCDAASKEDLEKAPEPVKDAPKPKRKVRPGA